jgi:hypothetical protein
MRSRTISKSAGALQAIKSTRPGKSHATGFIEIEIEIEIGIGIEIEVPSLFDYDFDGDFDFG